MAAADLARHLGVFLWEPADILGLSKDTLEILQKGGASWSAVAISVGEADAIIYNPAHIKGRRSSDIMHELSHIILAHEPGQLMVSPDTPYVLRSYNNETEEEANWLAGCLLLPRDALVYIKGKGLNDTEACDTYAVSHQLFTYRMNVTGVNHQFS